jgi:3-oxoacyl-[acyl-carrier protein] reductase
MRSGLKDKVILVTGGAGGIGTQISKAFSEEGAKVIVHYHQSEKNAEKLAKELGCKAIKADLTDSNQASNLFEQAIEMEGGIDVCIANAGFYPKQSTNLWNIDDKRWNETINTNLSLTFNTSREFLKHTSKTKQGSLVLVGSTAGIYGEAGHSDYAAAKGAIISGLLKTLKNEVAQIGDRVRVNAVAPGWTITDDKLKDELDNSNVKKITSTMALKKLATPEDVANSIVMLASNKLSSHVTGQIIEIAGGMEGRQITGIK